MEDIPPYLPFGTQFRVPTPASIMAIARDHALIVRTHTLNRVNSAFELADLARQHSAATFKRASSYSMLDALAVKRVEEHVQRSWRVVIAMRAAMVSCVNMLLLPFIGARAFLAALWAIVGRPAEDQSIAECGTRDTPQRQTKVD